MAEMIQRIIVSLLLWLVVAVVLFLMLPATLSTYDESLILTGALQWLAGLRTGVDFYTTYGPLEFMVVGEVLKNSNFNLLAPRLVFTILLSIPIVILCSVVNHTTPLFKSLIIAFVCCLSVYVFVLFPAALYPNYMVLLPLSLILYIKVIGVEGKYSFTLLLALCIATTILLRPGFGILLGGSLLLAVFFESIHIKRAGLIDRVITTVVALVVAAAIVIVFDLATQGSVSGVLGLIRNIHSVVYPEFRELPFPSVTGILPTSQFSSFAFITYFPVFAVIAGGVIYCFSWARLVELCEKQRSVIFWLCFFTGLLYSMALVRTDAAHLAPTVVFSIALGGVLLSVLSKLCARWFKGYNKHKMVAYPCLIVGSSFIGIFLAFCFFHFCC